MIQSKRILSIEAFRFFSIIQICLWHYNKLNGSLSAGFLGVEFFYILSGIFLYKAAINKKENRGIIRYTVDKLEKFYIEYLLAIIIIYIVRYNYIFQEIQVEGPLYFIFKLISQIFLLQEISVFGGSYNNPTWFFAVLIWGGMLVYGLTKYWTKLSIIIIFPILILFYLEISIRSEYGSLEIFKSISFISTPLLRGIAELGFGCLIGYLIFNYKRIINLYPLLISFLSVISICLYIFLIIYGENFTQYSLILISIILMSCFCEKSIINVIFNSNLWAKLGELSFSLFIIHYPLYYLIRIFTNLYQINSRISLFLYLVLLIPIAILFKIFSDTVKAQINHKRNIHIYKK